jgi:hypothetical protein
MSTSMMIAALRQGNNGQEILNILDAIIQPEEQTNIVEFVMPTLEEIEF